MDRIGLDTGPEMTAAGYPYNIYVIERNIEEFTDKDSGIVQGLRCGPDRDAPIGFRLAYTRFCFQL